MQSALTGWHGRECTWDQHGSNIKKNQVLLYFLSPSAASLLVVREHEGTNTRQCLSAPASHRHVTQQGKVWCWCFHAKPVARQCNWEALHSLNKRQQNASTRQGNELIMVYSLTPWGLTSLHKHHSHQLQHLWMYSCKCSVPFLLHLFAWLNNQMSLNEKGSQCAIAHNGPLL